jgi:uncharacterized protein
MQPLAYSKNRGADNTSPYLPDFIAEDILAIDFKKLADLGIRHVVFDLDQTLRRAYSRQLEAEVVLYLQELQAKKLFRSISIMSNNHRNLKRFSEAVNIPTFQPYWQGVWIVRKPNIRFFRHVLGALDAQPHETVMIGDKIHTDIAGANKVGMRTVLVKPRGQDYWFNLLMLARLREARKYQKLLKAYQQRKQS